MQIMRHAQGGLAGDGSDHRVISASPQQGTRRISRWGARFFTTANDQNGCRSRGHGVLALMVDPGWNNVPVL
jgi:hypothetical protein